MFGVGPLLASFSAPEVLPQAEPIFVVAAVAAAAVVAAVVVVVAADYDDEALLPGNRATFSRHRAIPSGVVGCPLRDRYADSNSLVPLPDLRAYPVRCMKRPGHPPPRELSAPLPRSLRHPSPVQRDVSFALSGRGPHGRPRRFLQQSASRTGSNRPVQTSR